VEVAAVTALPAQAVWDVLADAHSFATWVVGTKQIRGATADWPCVGSALYHRWGPVPFRVRDRSVVTASVAPSRLELEAGARPVALVRIRIVLTAVPDGTRVVLDENIVRGLALVAPPLTRRVQRWRNRRGLQQLLRLAQTRSEQGR